MLSAVKIQSANKWFLGKLLDRRSANAVALSNVVSFL